MFVGLSLAGACACVTGVFAQDARPPDIGLTISEALKPKDGSASSRDDLREIPAPRTDRLSDTTRVRVTVGDQRCYPGEEGVMPMPARSVTGGSQPVRFR